jgi:hypothetical protein
MPVRHTGVPSSAIALCSRARGVDDGDRAGADDVEDIVGSMKAAVSSSRPRPTAKGL